MEAIRASWGSRRVVSGWRVDVTFVQHADVAVSGDGDVLTLPPPTVVAPVDELRWALERTRARHAALPAAASHWSFKCDDITFVMVENLVRYLGALDSRCGRRPLAAGKRLRAGSGELFLSGGAGIALNRGAMESILTRWDLVCAPLFAKHNWWKTAAPDVGFAQCLRAMEITPIITRTAAGAERFHAFGPTRLVRGKYDPWFTEYSAKAGEPIRIDDATSKAMSCCAPGSATFHYVEADLARHLDRVLHAPERWRAMDGASRFAAWPKHVGGHSRRPSVSKPRDALVWPLLLDVMDFRQPTDAAALGTNAALCDAGEW